MWHAVLIVLRVGLLVYVGFCLLLYLRQSQYVYVPDRDVAMTPADAGLDYEPVELDTPDGERVAGWFVSSPLPEAERRGTALFCHGNAGDIGDRVESVLTFCRLGLDVLIFDYRGYGDSSGRPDEQGTYRDAMAAWQYLAGERGVPASRILVFGRSLGGAVALWLASQVRPGAVAAESSFTSAPDMARKMFPLLPTRWLSRFKYDSVAALGAVSCPVLIAHGPDDEVIPFSHGERLFAAAPEPKRFVAFEGGHNDGGLDADAAYQREFAAFVARHLAR